MGFPRERYNPRLRVILWWVSLAFFLAPAGCEKKKQAPPPPPSVTVAQPVRQVVTDYLELTGNIQAVNTVQLVARVPGYLDKVLFQDGQMVKKGQVLFIIQQAAYKDRLQQAEGQVLAQQAQLEYSQDQVDRYSNLVPIKAAAQTELDNWRYQRDTARAGLKTATANRNLARLDLEYTRVTAPFDGRIDRRLQDSGSMVGSGTSNSVLAQLSQVHPIYVYFTITDVDLARLMGSTRGLPGRKNSEKWPVFIGLTKEEGFRHEGRLDFAASSLTATTGTLLLRGVLPNRDGRILPGLYARVRVPLEKREAVLVPEAAVGTDQQGAFVLVVNGKNLVERRGVKTGSLIDTLRVVEEGLNGEELVIVKGVLKARPGSTVTPVKGDLPSAQTPPQAPAKTR